MTTTEGLGLTLEWWYAFRFGNMAPTLLMCDADGMFPGVRYGHRDRWLRELTVFTALTFPG